jgi:hypothetical protein
MPSRKQRRRREKLQRHEYEYVIETEEGEEVVENLREIEPEAAPRSEKRRTDRDGRQPRPKSAGSSGRGPVDRRGRPIPEPSIRRVLKRALIFTPFFVLFFFIAAPSLTVAQKIFQAVLLAALFIPASYLADRLIYRMALSRQQGQTGRTRR